MGEYGARAGRTDVLSSGGREVESPRARTRPVLLPCGRPRTRSSHGVTWAQRKVAGPDPNWHLLGWPVIVGAEGSRRERLRQRTTVGRPHSPLGSPGVPCTGVWGCTMANIEGQRPAEPQAIASFVQEPFVLLLLPAATNRRTRLLRGTGKSSQCPLFTPSHRKSSL